MQEYGSLVEIIELTNTYENGELDIKTKGDKVFRILEIIKEIPDKLYGGAIVSYPDNFEKGIPELIKAIMTSVRELHQLLKVDKDFKKKEEEINAYDLAHHVGLSLEEEYQLLMLTDERQRQEYLKRHLAKVLPVVKEMEALKEKIKMNGHFKNLEGLNL